MHVTKTTHQNKDNLAAKKMFSKKITTFFEVLQVFHRKTYKYVNLQMQSCILTQKKTSQPNTVDV